MHFVEYDIFCMGLLFMRLYIEKYDPSTAYDACPLLVTHSLFSKQAPLFLKEHMWISYKDPPAS